MGDQRISAMLDDLAENLEREYRRRDEGDPRQYGQEPAGFQLDIKVIQARRMAVALNRRANTLRGERL